MNSNRDRVRVRLPEDVAARGVYMQRIRALLPANFAAHARPMESDEPNRAQLWAVITGEDSAGWTLEGYVLPRLASALIFPELLPACPSWPDATEMLVECNTCGGTGEWETTTEESPDELVLLGPCPDC